jgi:protein-S-isoprenylcysteine O-methyltransferase Ste14
MDWAQIALAWMAYGLLHSLLASHGVKAWLMRCVPPLKHSYRLFFNGMALVLLLPPLWLTGQDVSPALWHWPLWLSWPALLLSVAGFAWSLRWYDGIEFLGLRHEVQPKMVLSPLHRYVRHPWYSLGLLLFWTRDLNAAWLVAGVAVSCYVAIGIYFEERKLLAELGEPYRRYRARVPALLPWPGRSLSAAEAQAWQ